MERDMNPAGSLFKPLPTKRAFEEIAGQIRALIYMHTLKPGDRLPAERELAIQFGTGRMAVREALRMLEQAGFVQIRQGSDGGAFVRDVDPGVASQSISDAVRRANTSLSDVTAVRVALEALVGELVVKMITDEELDFLDRSIREAEFALNYGVKHKNDLPDVELVAEMNVDFHILLARATKNLLLEIITESMMNVIHLFFAANSQQVDFFQWHIAQHRAIYEAVKAKNAPKVKALLKSHALELHKRFSTLNKPADFS
jgi:GntR family transcriptional repressor for pyruvate dehydrogenase complex